MLTVLIIAAISLETEGGVTGEPGVLTAGVFGAASKYTIKCNKYLK